MFFFSASFSNARHSQQTSVMPLCHQGTRAKSRPRTAESCMGFAGRLTASTELPWPFETLQGPMRWKECAALQASRSRMAFPEFSRPVLVSIITDGHPEGPDGTSEHIDSLKQAILDCGRKLESNGFNRNGKPAYEPSRFIQWLLTLNRSGPFPDQPNRGRSKS